MTSTGLVFAGYNDIYGNTSGATNGGIIWGNGNTLLAPRLNTVTGYTIMSALSPAVDTATNIPGVSSTFNGLGPDMGYKESAFTAINLWSLLCSNVWK